MKLKTLRKFTIKQWLLQGYFYRSEAIIIGFMAIPFLYPVLLLYSFDTIWASSDVFIFTVLFTLTRPTSLHQLRFLSYQMIQIDVFFSLLNSYLFLKPLEILQMVYPFYQWLILNRFLYPSLSLALKLQKFHLPLWRFYRLSLSQFYAFETSPSVHSFVKIPL